jgi:hypothetical protein
MFKIHVSWVAWGNTYFYLGFVLLHTIYDNQLILWELNSIEMKTLNDIT